MNRLNSRCPITRALKQGHREQQEVLEGRHYIELHRVLGPPHAYAFSITTHGFEQFARIWIPKYGMLCADVGRILVRQVLQEHGQASKQGVAGELNQPRMIIEHIFKVFKDSGLIKYGESIGGDLFMDVYWVSPELRRRLEGNG